MTLTVEFHPALMEEAVWSKMRRHHPAGKAFDHERASIYGETDIELRHAVFGRFFASWFRKLELDAPVRTALADSSEMLRAVDRCLVGPGCNSSPGGAELFVAGTAKSTIVISILPELLCDVDAALRFLRRELTHITDMLDPGFHYEPRLPRQPAGPAHDRILQDRYRILWNCSIDGRLVRRGRLPESARASRSVEFRHYFACLGEHVDTCFKRVFAGPRPSHTDLVDLARNPEVGFGLRLERPPSRHQCSLCGFPTFSFEPAPETMADDVLGAIRSDFPGWTSERGLCRQCADLYRSRGLLTGPLKLPGNIIIDDAGG